VADEVDRFAIADRANDAFDPAGNADQVKRRSFRKAVGRQQAQSAIARHRHARLRRNDSLRLRQARQHLQRTGEVELSQLGEQDKADSEIGHDANPRFCSAAQVEARIQPPSSFFT
jgi:hypothetical protein